MTKINHFRFSGFKDQNLHPLSRNCSKRKLLQNDLFCNTNFNFSPQFLKTNFSHYQKCQRLREEREKEREKEKRSERTGFIFFHRMKFLLLICPRKENKNLQRKVLRLQIKKYLRPHFSFIRCLLIFLPLVRINPCSLNFYTERQQDLSRRITTELISARHHRSSCQASVSQIKGLMISGQPKSQCQFLLPWYLKEKKKIKLIVFITACSQTPNDTRGRFQRLYGISIMGLCIV